MNQTPPFRTYLRAPEPKSDVGRLQARTSALEKIIQNTPLALEEMIELIRHSDEDILWLLWKLRGHELRWEPGLKKIRKALCDRAIADAKAEGVVWTPVIDVLAYHYTFQQVALETEGSVEAWDMPHIEDRGDIEVDSKLALRLASWIREQTDPTALHPLLQFHAPAMRQVLAREMRVADEGLLNELESAGEFITIPLAQNQHLQNILAERWWRMYQKGKKKHKEDQRYRAGRLLAILSEKGTGLPIEVRNEILAHLRRNRNKTAANELVELILREKDPLTAEGMKSLVPFLSVTEMSKLALSGRLDTAALRLVIEKPSVAFELSTRKETPPELLALIFAQHPRSAKIVNEIAFHPHTPLETLREIAQSSRRLPWAMRLIAARENARKDPVIRSILIKVKSGHVAYHMLPEANAQEYPSLLQRIARDLGPARAIECLESYPPPKGTQIPSRFWGNLLSSADRKDRLKAIMLMGQYGHVAAHEKAEKHLETRRRTKRDN